MEQQQVPKLSTRVYSKKPLGAYPEVDDSIIHDATATKPHERYLVLGEKFTGSLAAARALASDMLKVANRNIETHVDYEPATGWHFKHGRRIKSDEGSKMTQPVTEVQASGKWLDAINAMNKWVADTTKPTADQVAELDAWNKKHRRLEDSITYHKGVALGTVKPRGVAKGSTPRPTPTPRTNKTTTLGSELGREKPAATTKERVRAAIVNATHAIPLQANISIGGMKISCDTIVDLERAVTMIKGMVK